MTDEQIRKAWFQSKAGILEEYELELVKSEVIDGKVYKFYQCPCGGNDHYAMRGMELIECADESGYHSFAWSPVLNCCWTRQQWLVRPVNIARVIEEEEMKYIKLMERAPAVVKKIVKERGWSDETAAFLEDTHGIDRELVQSIVDG